MRVIDRGEVAGAAVAEIPTTMLMSHPGMGLVTPSRVPMAPTTQA